MSAEIVREQLIQIINHLDEDRLTAILHFAENLEAAERRREEYDESKDILLTGLLEGPVDLSERVEEILEEEVKRRGSWTTKDDSP